MTDVEVLPDDWARGSPAWGDHWGDAKWEWKCTIPQSFQVRKKLRSDQVAGSDRYVSPKYMT